MTKKGRDECKRSKPIFSVLAYTMENNQKMRKRCPALHLSLFCLSVCPFCLLAATRTQKRDERTGNERQSKRRFRDGFLLRFVAIGGVKDGEPVKQ
jgi:hypothetical protein